MAPIANVSVVSLAACLVQASSRSWTGAKDECLNPVDGIPALVHTILKIQDHLPRVPVQIIAPTFDQEGDLPRIVKEFGLDVRLLFEHDASPLRRMVAATVDLPPDALVLRLDGLHMFIHPMLLDDLLEAASQGCDCVKTPDDFPATLSADLFRVSALRRAAELLPIEDKNHIHVKHFMAGDPRFNVLTCPSRRHYQDGDMHAIRHRAHQLYPHDFLDHEGSRAIPAGDQLSFHYKLALDRLESCDTVLDIACGAGYGSMMLTSKARHVLGGDIAPDVISYAKSRFGDRADNLEFKVLDALDTRLPDASIDAITSFETIEHIPNTEPFLAELARILKPEGIAFFSAPQNAFGQIPLNPHHVREFSHGELTKVLSTAFDIVEFVGIKQGCIVIDGDPVGQSSFVMVRSRRNPGPAAILSASTALDGDPALCP